jgi:hypothetical protein
MCIRYKIWRGTNGTLQAKTSSRKHGIFWGVQASSADPTLPLGAAICYCAYKLYDKRSKRMGAADPDRTPIWGALGATILALVVGGALSIGLVSVLPLPPRVSGEGLASLLIALSLGFVALFLK